MSVFFCLAASLLLAVNLYGLTQRLEPEGIDEEFVYFRPRGKRPSYTQCITASRRVEGESDLALAKRLNQLVALRLLHIHWFKFAPEKFHQRIPVWENYFLWSLGASALLPQFQRYHFVGWKKSLCRGIGVCGDKAMCLSRLLDMHHIEHKIISNKRHVFLEANIDGVTFCFDPDYGVEVPIAATQIQREWDATSKLYAAAGAHPNNVQDLKGIFQLELHYWDGVSEFAARRYMAEPVFYAFKWLVPVAIALFPNVV